MRTTGRTGRTVALRLRFADYSRASRSRTLAHPTAATRAVLATARELLAATMPAIERKGLTLVGITVSNLERGGAPAQLALRSTTRPAPPSTPFSTGFGTASDRPR